MKVLLLPLCLVLLLPTACKRPADGEQTAAPPAAAQPGDVAPIEMPGDQPAEPSDAPPAEESAEATPKPTAPTLQVKTIDGSSYDLSQHRGKWVVVNFWATWCAPCLKEMPELSALDAMREHVEVIGLAYEEIEPAEMKAFLQKHPVVYPVAVLDVYAPPQDFATPRGLPMTYLIAPDGKVAKQFLGPVTAKDIEDTIAKAVVTKSGAPNAST